MGRNSDGSTTDLRFPALLCRRKPERAAQRGDFPAQLVMDEEVTTDS